jgi:hypothetical protein
MSTPNNPEPKPEEKQEEEQDTCPESDTTCSSKQEKEQQAEEPTEEEEGGTEVIRTIPIQMPSGTTQVRPKTVSPQAASPQAASSPQQQGPGMRNLVRFLNNPEGAIARNSRDYLCTMYSTDQVDLVVKSALNSGSYY